MPGRPATGLLVSWGLTGTRQHLPFSTPPSPRPLPLPSPQADGGASTAPHGEAHGEESSLYKTDEFRMFCFKVGRRRQGMGRPWSCSHSCQPRAYLDCAWPVPDPRVCGARAPCLPRPPPPLAQPRPSPLAAPRVAPPRPPPPCAAPSRLQVLPCSKRYCHDWTTCPFAHPGEKAKRRDPRAYTYTGVACPEMKKVREGAGALGAGGGGMVGRVGESAPWEAQGGKAGDF